MSHDSEQPDHVTTQRQFYADAERLRDEFAGRFATAMLDNFPFEVLDQKNMVLICAKAYQMADTMGRVRAVR